MVELHVTRRSDWHNIIVNLGSLHCFSLSETTTNKLVMKSDST